MADQQAQPEIETGTTFAVEMPKDKTIEQARDDARKLFGREIHIQVKIGPIEIGGGGKSLDCPIEAVDEPALVGLFNRWPQRADHYLLIGYFK